MWPPKWGGVPVQRVRRLLSIALHIQYSQVNVTQAKRDNHHWVRNSTLPPAHSLSSSLASCPCGEGSCPPFVFQTVPPFSTQIPQSMQRVLQGLEVVPDLPSPKVQLGGYPHQPAPCGLIRVLQAWCHPGGCYFMVLPTHEVQLQVPFLSREW